MNENSWQSRLWQCWVQWVVKVKTTTMEMVNFCHIMEQRSWTKWPWSEWKCQSVNSCQTNDMCTAYAHWGDCLNMCMQTDNRQMQNWWPCNDSQPWLLHNQNQTVLSQKEAHTKFIAKTDLKFAWPRLNLDSNGSHNNSSVWDICSHFWVLYPLPRPWTCVDPTRYTTVGPSGNSGVHPYKSSCFRQRRLMRMPYWHHCCYHLDWKTPCFCILHSRITLGPRRISQWGQRSLCPIMVLVFIHQILSN